jgi:hypothetical protein
MLRVFKKNGLNNELLETVVGRTSTRPIIDSSTEEPATHPTILETFNKILII